MLRGGSTVDVSSHKTWFVQIDFTAVGAGLHVLACDPQVQAGTQATVKVSCGRMAVMMVNAWIRLPLCKDVLTEGCGCRTCHYWQCTQTFRQHMAVEREKRKLPVSASRACAWRVRSRQMSTTRRRMSLHTCMVAFSGVVPESHRCTAIALAYVCGISKKPTLLFFRSSPPTVHVFNAKCAKVDRFSCHCLKIAACLHLCCHQIGQGLET